MALLKKNFHLYNFQGRFYPAPGFDHCPGSCHTILDTCQDDIVISVNLLRVYLVLLSRSLIKILNGTGPNTESWGTPPVTSCQIDASPFTAMLWAWPLRRFLTQWLRCSEQPTCSSHGLQASPEE